jgi:hypothetical protein
VQNKAKEDEVIARYLLGSLTEQEQSALEERFFADNEFFERMLEVEEDLIDEYLQDELPDSEHEQMEKLLRSSRRQWHELEFNRLLAYDVRKFLARSKKLSEVEPTLASVGEPARWQRLIGPLWEHTSWARSTPVAALVLSALIVPLLVWNFMLKNDIRRLQLERAQLETNDEELKKEINRQNETIEQLRRQVGDEQQKRQELDKKLAQMQRAAPSQPSSAGPIFLSADSISRDNSQLSAIRINPGARQIRIELELGPNESFEYYGVTIKTFGGQKILDKNVIRTIKNGSGNLVLSLPADSFRKGDYILTLRGRKRDEPYTEIRDYAFSVKR